MYKVIYICLIIAIFKPTFGQKTIQFSTEDGLPSNTVYDIKQDLDGFIWLATNRGVVKYNGSTFKTFTLKDGLPNNDVWLLEVDDQNRIWYVSKSKYQGYIKNDLVNKFKPKKDEIIDPVGYIHKMDGKIFYHSWVLENDVWINNLSAYHWSVVNRVFSSYGLSREVESIGYLPINKFFFFQKGRFMIYDLEGNKVDDILLDKGIHKNHFRNSKILGYRNLFNDTILIVSKYGILFVNHATRKNRYYSFKELVNREEVSMARINADGNKIEISIKGALFCFDYQYQLKSKKTFPDLIDDHVIFEDDNGNIWIGGLNNGLKMIPKVSIESTSFLKDEKVQRIGLWEKQLIAGVPNKGYYRINTKNNSVSNFGNFNPEFSIYEISDAFIISATALQSVEKPQFIYQNMTRFKDAILHNGNYYIISGGGVFILDDDFSNEKLHASRKGLTSLINYKNRIYLGGSDGLSYIENEEIVELDLAELNDVPVNYITVKNEQLYICTRGRGLYTYDGTSITHLKNTDNYDVQKIIFDSDELIYFATQNGIQVLNYNSNRPEASEIVNAFYKSDGILDDNVNDIYMKDSLLYVATDRGLSRININNPHFNVCGEIFFQTSTDTLRYKYEKQNQHSINFFIKDFVNQKHYTYQYKIDPLNEEWITIRNKTLNFSSLDPGSYDINVKVKDHHLNETTKKIHLEILPLWWQTKLMKILFSILAIGLIGLVYFNMKKRIRKAERLKAQKEKHLLDLELRALRSQMNPHFIHNSLNAIQYYIQNNEVEMSEDYISKFSKLIRQFFEYSRKQTISIEDEIELLNNYLSLEKLRFEEKLNYSFTIHEKLNRAIVIPSMILQPIVENAINHGIFHMKGKGQVDISFNYINPSVMEVIVKDNGIGINQARKMVSKAVNKSSSRSSDVLVDRLELLKQSNDWTINYSIQDLQDLNQGNGTIVTLRILQKNSIEVV